MPSITLDGFWITITLSDVSFIVSNASQKNPQNTVIELRQSVRTSYTGEGNNGEFVLSNALGLSKPMTFDNERKCTQIIAGTTPEAVAANLAGKKIVGRIIMNSHDKPQWNEQKPNVHTGKFYTTRLDLTGIQSDEAPIPDVKAEVPVVMDVKAE